MEKAPDEIEESPIEQVRLTIPTEDDNTLPVLTIRTWVLGIATCLILAFMMQILAFRQNFIIISPICIQLLVLPLGNLMAKVLPTEPVKIPLTKWKFSMNPGPFNMKEHALIYTLTSAGNAYPAALEIITQLKIFYHRKINYLITFLMVQTTQLLGFGFAGMFMKFLVDSPYMWFPGVVSQYSLFRALHEKETRTKGSLTRFQFFLIAAASSFAYYIVPNYLFPSISALSFICWIWRDSITAQIIGSGRNGLGIGSFALDWTVISGFLGGPLEMPVFTLVNVMVGFILIVYIITPITYWTNSYNAKRFPIFSTGVYDQYGQQYNVSRIINEKKFEFDQTAYDNYSKIYLSSYNIYYYGVNFAVVMATLSHVALFHGRSIWSQFRQAYRKQTGDIHTKLMKKNYAPIPQWWFYVILISMICLAIYSCEEYKGEVQLPYWGLLLSCGLAFIFILPVSVIAATSNRYPNFNMALGIIGGYLFHGRPLADMTFKLYGSLGLSQAALFINDFKLCHYMKIPPRSMFLVQIVGTLISTTFQFFMQWYILSSVKNICDVDKLPKGSQWTCPFEHQRYMDNVIWGLAGPSRVFFPSGQYSKLFIFFFIGALAPVLTWLLARKYPNKQWIKLINIPIIFGATASMPPARSVNYWSWFVVGFLFNYFVYRRYKGWWAKYNYVLSNALDAGCAFMAVLIAGAIQLPADVYGMDWWGLDAGDHCPLASCPTAPGVVVDGCPTFT